MSTKFAPGLRARAIWKSKSLKRRGFGALLEVELDKICTTPARESDLEVKIVKNWRWERFWKLSFAKKFAPRLRARVIWKSKSLKTGGVGALLEVELRKICTTPGHESDFYEKKAPRCMFGALLEVELRKICTTPGRESDFYEKKAPRLHVRSTFGSGASQNLRHACARDRFGSQNR